MSGVDSRSALTLHKSEAQGSRGLVGTKHPEASGVGLDTLRAGGNAVDAAVAAAFAVGVAEPWSSGIGGGGYAVVAGPAGADVIAFPMQAPALATPDRYPLDGREGVGGFLWPGVVDDANLVGWSAMSIPGAVAGLALLHRRHGRLPWRTLVEPAVELARRGSRLTWFDLLQMGRHTAAARRHAELGRIYYADGGPAARRGGRDAAAGAAGACRQFGRRSPGGTGRFLPGRPCPGHRGRLHRQRRSAAPR